MPTESYIAIANVVAISGGTTLVCEVDGSRIAVPRAALHPHSEVRAPGDRGTLTIAESVARELGLGGQTGSFDR